MAQANLAFQAEPTARPLRCPSKATLPPSHPLANRTVYLPCLGEGSSQAVASCFHRYGVAAEVTPASNRRCCELARRHMTGDECYPAVVTTGDFLAVAGRPGFDPSRSAFLMPAAEGPCRLGQYVPALRDVLHSAGYDGATIVSPSDSDGFAGWAGLSLDFRRLVWRTIVSAGLLHQALLRTRPYEAVLGAASLAFQESLADLCGVIENSAGSTCVLGALVGSLTRARDRFRRVPTRREESRPLIGVVGEVFCRMNPFANDDLVRQLEALGAEVWLSEAAELIEYNLEAELQDLRLRGRRFSARTVGARIRKHVQQTDLHALRAPFAEDSAGREEPSVETILELAEPYLPPSGAVGEMVVSVGKASYLAHCGADGVVDISPFGCMNGIVCEAIYPRLSRDHGRIPIRSFHCDGNQTELADDLGTFVELARSYSQRKTYQRPFTGRSPGLRAERGNPIQVTSRGSVANALGAGKETSC